MAIDFSTLAQKYGTPLYVYDFDKITENYQAFKDAFAGEKSLISYAVKANSNLSVISHLGKMGAGADCVSIGEVHRALAAGIERYKIIFSGGGKQDYEIEEALNAEILMLNLESEAEMKRVELVAKALGKVARVSIRINPNVDPKTHPYISTGLHENKFGVEIDMAKRMYIYIKNSPHLEPIGIHFHIGSQLTELAPIAEAAEIVADLVHSLKAIGVEIKFFNVGGGVGISYEGEQTIDPEAYAEVIAKATKGLDVTLMCELGRSLVGDAGYLLSSVLYEKQNGDKRFVIVDAAMNDLLRPTLYNAYHRVELLSETEAKESEADIVGPICESGDWLAKAVMIPETKHNDLIIVHSAGAYGFTMSSNYNTRGRVAEVAVEEDRDRLIRERESLEDQLRLEIGYLK
jgi:diaminopimelate decarboxylase